MNHTQGPSTIYTAGQFIEIYFFFGEGFQFLGYITSQQMSIYQYHYGVMAGDEKNALELQNSLNQE